MTYGLPGFSSPGVILHPGTGGEVPRPEKRWAKRFHPLRLGFRHSYKVLIRLSYENSFTEAMQSTWRNSYDQFAPPVVPADLHTVYQDSLDLLATYAKDYNGIPGIPFAVHLKDGTPKFVSFQMGFVGQQTTAAYHLLRHGLATKQPKSVAMGESIVDFWVAQSLTEAGLPRTWYDPYPQPHWIPYNTFLRIASDGAEGILHAWGVMHRHGQRKTAWLRFCERFGRWLVTHQNSDGSFYREYDFNGTPVGRSRLGSTHPIQFLVDLSKATGQKGYLDAALRAGTFCLSHVHKLLAYVGGTPDNPDVMTRESGLIAIDAFLSLYDATQEKVWLDAASQAANFSETWLYVWNVPIPQQDERADFPKGISTSGLSIIATGQSGADVFMAAYPFQYYRLYLYTGDQHFLTVARLLLHNTKQIVDRQGSHGYAHSGMLTEALTVRLPVVTA